jgi:acyl-CoA hydrolase
MPAKDNKILLKETIMTIQEKYKTKLRTLEECVRFIQNGDSIITSGAAGEPGVFLRSIPEWGHGVKGVTIHKSRELMFDYLRDPTLKGHIHTVGHFFSENLREGYQIGTCSYVPSDLHNFMTIRGQVSPDKIFWARTTAMEKDGNFCIPYCQFFEYEAMQNASHIILEVNLNPKYAPVRGACRIPIDRVDMLYEVNEPLFTLPEFVSTEKDEKIGSYIASLIHDGDCIQFGLGGLPDALARHLMDKNDLGMHSEMFSSSMARLIEAGVITGKVKNLNRGEHIATFILGDENLYRVASEDKNFRLVPCSYGNDPKVIAQNDNMVSVNTLLEIDLTGQINSESIGPLQWSGTGGADDYAIGAMHSKGGRGIFAFESTTRKGISKIKSTLAPGSVVSVSRNHADIIVTEYGYVSLRGKTVSQRVEAVISIAHPDFRADLRAEAKKLKYID